MGEAMHKVVDLSTSSQSFSAIQMHLSEQCKRPAQMSSMSCANKCFLETAVVSALCALCTVSVPLVLSVVVGFLLLLVFSIP